MTITHGFELLREEEIEERNVTARLYRHVKSGAELLSLENDDENKSFGIVFRTPPEDSTGCRTLWNIRCLVAPRSTR
jgi:Zn-dependent M16 (insulinase) family peptidase